MTDPESPQMTMPGGDTGVRGLATFFGQTLIDFVNNGTIPLSRVQDMAVSTALTLRSRQICSIELILAL